MREWLPVEPPPPLPPPPGERIEIRVLKYKVQRTTAYAATTLTLSTVFHLKPRCHANMVTLDTPKCSTCSERFPAWLPHPKPNEFLHFDLESCNLMCTYTVVTHPCDMPPLAQARPMMLCIYTSFYIHNQQTSLGLEFGS